MLTQTAAVAFFAGLAAAVHAPVGDTPKGNAFSAPGVAAGSNVVPPVPVGQPFTIRWAPDTPNTVSLLLLNGCPSNCVQVGAPISEGIANSGAFVWTPLTSLTPSVGTYGIQLIDDVNGQYQYTTNFTITNPTYGGASSSAPPPAPTSTGGGYPIYSHSSTMIVYPSSFVEESSKPAPTSTKVAPPPPPPSGTGYPQTSIAVPSGNGTVPTGVRPSSSAPSSTPPPESTGAASALRAGLGLAGAVAGAIFML